MKVADYDQFVRDTDQYRLRSRSDRALIAIYGLVSEIGSVVAGVKKKLLAEDGEKTWNQPNDEIKEELGDAIWYCFSLAQIANDRPVNIFTNDIALLKKEIGADDDRGTRIKDALDPNKRADFLAAAEHFPRTANMCFDDYQRLAFLTARTDGRVLLQVCLAVLWQLGAELLRNTLPKVEKALNKNVADRPINAVLGEIGWHLAAIASLYELSLDMIVEENTRKLNFRKQGPFTDLHDEGFKPKERFPRLFKVEFVSIGTGRLRMYKDGRRLGDDLTDNAHKEDGYRFHDIIHLALAAHLGWSPVLRKLLGVKRRSREEIDEVEDGARAQIVEETIVAAIYTEGDRLANESDRCQVPGPIRFFPTRDTISFKFLKFLQSFVKPFEVKANKFWEWDNAIFEGAEIFFRLRQEGQGTVTVDLVNRKLSFSPEVTLKLKGPSVSVGVGVSNIDEDGTSYLSSLETAGASAEVLAKLISAKKAILSAIGVESADTEAFREITLVLNAGGVPSLKIAGRLLRLMREREILDFRFAFSVSGSEVRCTAMAIADPADLK